MELIAPLVEVGKQEEAPGTVGAAMPMFGLPKPQNFAEVDMVKEQVENELVPLTTVCRSSRASVEEEWRAIRRMELQIHDTGQRYQGRSNAYLPVYGRNLQAIVSSLSQGLFPSDEYMDVVDRESGDPQRAKPVKQYLQWEFDTVAQLRRVMKPFLRQFSNLGTSAIKYFYKKELRKQGRLKLTLNAISGMAAEPSFRMSPTYEGLCVSARNMHHLHVFPVYAERVEDLTCIFEDIDISVNEIKKMGALKRWANVETALNAPEPSEHQVNQVEQLSNFGLTTLSSQSNSLRGLGEYRTLTEAWCYLRLPNAAYEADEEKGAPVPCRVVLAGTTPLEVTRNPFWHQRPPYLFARQNVLPGLFYGHGYGRLTRSLQYLTNDFANQTNDCGNYALNPVLKVNPALLAGPLRPLAPGVVWPMSDVREGAAFERPPLELIGAGLQMVNAVMGMAQDLGGAPPQLQGVGGGGGKGSKTATGMQILQHNALGPLQDLVEDIELDVMVPLMFGTWVNAQQYRDQQVIATVAGQPIAIDPSMLAIDPEFRWLASSQAMNQQMRAQQLVQFVQSVLPVVPLLNQLGYLFDPVPLFSRIYGDGFGLRGFDQVFRPMQAPMAQMGQMGAPGMGGPAMAPEQGDRIRSALEQVGNMGAPAPGEGNEFMDVRAGADEMAAQMGAMNGGFA